MIVGTAGHIDHGKTTLVRALTGVDTDRLPEEKARGMSIELGYAYLDLPGSTERIGFVDVPGHERLVRTMLAGATGIDFALLLVAADDGVMPQTREHVAVLSLLGLGRGAVALTKIDRVEASRLEQVRHDIAALLADTPLALAPVLPVSSVSGDGIGALRDLLFAAAEAAEAAEADSPGQLVDAQSSASTGNGNTPQHAFRLAIDRSFTLPGTGSVVTGMLHAGRLAIGDEVLIVPSPDGKRARVRGLHAQDRAVAESRCGQRCAVALAAIGRDEVARGQWLVAAEVAFATQRLDAQLTVWPDEAKPLRSGTPVHVHVGAADVLGTVTVLQAGPVDAEGGVATSAALAPGRQGFVQIMLREPLAAWRGDRIVLRDASASRTLAGGIVLDPFAPTRYRRTAQRLAELAAWALPTAASRLARLIDAAPHGVSLRRWACAEGLSIEHVPALPPGSLLSAQSTGDDWALGGSHRDSLVTHTLAALRTFHAREPELLGPDAGRLRRLAAPRLPEPLWRALLETLRQDGRLTVRGACLHLPEHGLRLSATDERLAQRIAPLLASAGFDGCWARDLARAAGESEALMRTTIARLAQRGELHQVVKDLCYAPATIARLTEQARVIADAEGGAVTAAGFRDATGLGRKRAIQVLEYFDRIGLLRRVGDAHRLRRDSAHLAAASASASASTGPSVPP